MPNATPCMCQQKMYVENDKEVLSISSIISPSSSLLSTSTGISESQVKFTPFQHHLILKPPPSLPHFLLMWCRQDCRILAKSKHHVFSSFDRKGLLLLSFAFVLLK
mmetsp:Transcript_22453/g.53222  ORF Transcript_22453/g.53222 Transcript_22453/m.53222 type:complete len:106 (+) Transcript_22453:62-379(+)